MAQLLLHNCGQRLGLAALWHTHHCCIATCLSDGLPPSTVSLVFYKVNVCAVCVCVCCPLRWPQALYPFQSPQLHGQRSSSGRSGQRRGFGNFYTRSTGSWQRVVSPIGRRTGGRWPAAAAAARQHGHPAGWRVTVVARSFAGSATYVQLCNSQPKVPAAAVGVRYGAAPARQASTPAGFRRSPVQSHDGPKPPLLRTWQAAQQQGRQDRQ